MSKAFKEFARLLYNEVKEGVANQLEKSVGGSSVGLFDGISMMSQFKFSDDGLSLNGSEISAAQSTILGYPGKKLETINELPSGAPLPVGKHAAPHAVGGGLYVK